jgi:hypothetical protein
MPTNRTADPFGGWFRVGLDFWMLGLESSSVIALRTMKIAAGGTAASDEAQRMVSEKMSAGVDLCQRAAFGQLGATMPGIAAAAIADCRKVVRANQRRLTRG